MTHRRNWTLDQRERYGSGNEERDEAGVIATLNNGEVIHCSGLVGTALRGIADYCDLHGLLVRSLSTLRTIVADLAVRDTYFNGLGRRVGALLPEQSLLGRIGRSDLYEGTGR